MPDFDVHVYREMRIKFTGVGAASPEAAAAKVAYKPINDAAECTPCDGRTFWFLVDDPNDKSTPDGHAFPTQDGKLLGAASKMVGLLEDIVARLGTNPMQDDELAARCREMIEQASGAHKIAAQAAGYIVTRDPDENGKPGYFYNGGENGTSEDEYPTEEAAWIAACVENGIPVPSFSSIPDPYLDPADGETESPSM